ncbi:unnamed protein product [Ceutorhynchus assimilis]|uniref:Uncharacterized protein n=1 Tax=Ceutorhynchus assimilis TaxID=467358 RepID=A0A9N9MWL5_9CUCU|nr:unnamed protein product [Ceutorhynchus assimilis]
MSRNSTCLELANLSYAEVNRQWFLGEALAFLKSLIYSDASESREINETIEETLREEYNLDPEDAENYFEGDKEVLATWIANMKKKVKEILLDLGEFQLAVAVESEFKNIEILPNVTRIDLAAERLINDYKGKLKIIECSNRSKHLKENRAVERKRKHSGKYAEQEHDKENLSYQSLGKSFLSVEISNRLVERSPFKDLEPQTNFEQSTTCMACLNGDFGTPSHKCILCNAAVHLLPGCSVAIELKTKKKVLANDAHIVTKAPQEMKALL